MEFARSRLTQKLIIRTDLLIQTDRAVVVLDKYPKAHFHYLVVTKEDIGNVSQLTREHLPLLDHMMELGNEIIGRQNYLPASNFIIGFKVNGFVDRLTMHVISNDFHAACLSKPNHWNSFHSELFLSFNAAYALLNIMGAIELPPSSKLSALRRANSFTCNQCDFVTQDFRILKDHLANHWQMLQNELQANMNNAKTEEITHTENVPSIDHQGGQQTNKIVAETELKNDELVKETAQPQNILPASEQEKQQTNIVEAEAQVVADKLTAEISQQQNKLSINEKEETNKIVNENDLKNDELVKEIIMQSQNTEQEMLQTNKDETKVEVAVDQLMADITQRQNLLSINVQPKQQTPKVEAETDVKNEKLVKEITQTQNIISEGEQKNEQINKVEAETKANNKKPMEAKTSKLSTFKNDAETEQLREILTHEMADPDKILVESDQAVVIKSKYPKAMVHFLVLPKTYISEVTALTREHLPLLEHMKDLAIGVIEKLDSFPLSNFLMGFKIVPFMNRLNMHVLSNDFHSWYMRRYEHWNTFNTDLFLSYTAAYAMLHLKDLIEPLSTEKAEELLHAKPLACNQCEFTTQYILQLKGHLGTHWRNREQEQKLHKVQKLLNDIALEKTPDREPLTVYLKDLQEEVDKVTKYKEYTHVTAWKTDPTANKQCDNQMNSKDDCKKYAPKANNYVQKHQGGQQSWRSTHAESTGEEKTAATKSHYNPFKNGPQKPFNSTGPNRYHAKSGFKQQQSQDNNCNQHNDNKPSCSGAENFIKNDFHSGRPKPYHQNPNHKNMGYNSSNVINSNSNESQQENRTISNANQFRAGKPNFKANNQKPKYNTNVPSCSNAGNNNANAAQPGTLTLTTADNSHNKKDQQGRPPFKNNYQKNKKNQQQKKHTANAPKPSGAPTNGGGSAS